MLYYPVGIPKPIRIQGCFVSDKEVEAVVEFIKSGKVVEYDEKIIEEIDKRAAAEKSSGRDTDSDDNASDEDPMITDAIECVIEAGQASTSLLQRRLKLGYARAARIIDQMEVRGIVGPFEGSKPREVRITRQQWQEMTMRNDSFDTPSPEINEEVVFEQPQETFDEE
jgi:S-DNA-T family DNA segregation ATPase FtsK/SpoIIIE